MAEPSQSHSLRSRVVKASAMIGVPAAALAIVAILALAEFWREESMTQEAASRVRCLHNLRTLGMASRAYADAHGGHYPERLEDLHIEDPSVLVCRSAKKARGLPYIYRGRELTSPLREELIIAHEPLSNHEDCIGVLFGDGSAEIMGTSEADHIPGLLNGTSDNVPPVATAVMAD